MNKHPESCEFTLATQDNQRLVNLCGQFDEHLRQIERRLGVEINNRGFNFSIIGASAPTLATVEIVKELYALTTKEILTPLQIHLFLQKSGVESLLCGGNLPQERSSINTKKAVIRAHGPNQQRYIHNLLTHDVNFGIGPAGTGKTYLAVASAVAAFEQDRVRRIILTRPAVEAGERLGYLPGDLAQKIDPYLRPLYDALYEMLGFDGVAKLLERNIIEIAPLAYMRGRTLNDAFIILDEAQNTTVEQMKMFLTRIGFGSTTVITGDVTQVDLPKHTLSGLRNVIEVLKDVDDISFTFFNAHDVVRHPLVQSIVTAYAAYESKKDDHS